MEIANRAASKGTTTLNTCSRKPNAYGQTEFDGAVLQQSNRSTQSNQL